LFIGLAVAYLVGSAAVWFGAAREPAEVNL
jgi:hypothetical protein